MNMLFKQSGKSAFGLNVYTWQDEWLDLLLSSESELGKVKLELLNTETNGCYGLTYVASDHTRLSGRLSELTDGMARSLVELDPEFGLMLFGDLLPNNYSVPAFHNLFALLSMAINNMKIHGAETSLHSPLNASEIDNGFPVHADLFNARALINVITRSDTFGGGDILLLPLASLEDALASTDAMPVDIKEKILFVLRTRVGRDAFDEIFDLMYGENPWKHNLAFEIQKRQLMLPGSFGSGYFLVDGAWLHGRTKINGPVLESRLQRLVFDTIKTSRMMSSNRFGCSYSSHNHDCVIPKALKSLTSRSRGTSQMLRI